MEISENSYTFKFDQRKGMEMARITTTDLDLSQKERKVVIIKTNTLGTVVLANKKFKKEKKEESTNATNVSKDYDNVEALFMSTKDTSNE